MNNHFEEDAWQQLERKQLMVQALTLEAEAQQRAMNFIMDMNNAELGIMTIRKAFEIGYRAGVYAEQRKKNE
jgi:hypothetical protein